ncbi:membrane protein [Agrilactobacillus composti DSM 18527 = JCM 14202]|uniref:Membrane protein n=1 Tax=Agrilactobacillus composti DSM 18527 = JCM 14202 TaxID=1423734 RepID=X0PCV5_9LACO|nr:ABC transporter permease [Agrilactobacillus composti]KRM33188.1 membrane protein [Agrilactobacillus composti DSM 18527 = JCM 14202]GAF38438.1 putative transporter, trans-membrane domain bacteriocin immunity protein [Agrilactobacillus composti DSM 18527 = JCM 14202]
MKYIRSEFAKNKRRNFWFAIIGLFVFSLLWGGVTANIQLMRHGQQIVATMIFNMSTIDNFIFPFLIALLTVRLVQPEHDYRMLQVLMTNGERPWDLFLAKFAVTSIVLLGGELLQIAMIIMMSLAKSGELHDFGVIGMFFLSIFIGGSVITLVQLALVFYLSRPIIPLCLGLAGSFLSLVTSGFLPKSLSMFIPWQYISVLNPFFLQGKGYHYTNLWPIYLVLVLAIGCVLLILIRYVMKIKERVVL